MLLVAASGACAVPFNLDQPTTRSLEAGVEAALTTSRSFELAGSFVEGGTRWDADLELFAGGTEQVSLDGGGVQLEAILLGGTAYFRGRRFLSDHLDAGLAAAVDAAGDAWWAAPAGEVPRLPDLTSGGDFRSTFLGAALDRRTDHLSEGGVDAVELSGPRADVFVAAAPPHRPLRIRLTTGISVDGISAAALTYSHFDDLAPPQRPAQVIDFSDLSTLPPLYTVAAVDTSGCGSPCRVRADLRNLGGRQPAVAPSSVTFTLTGRSGAVLGGCRAVVAPDVGYNATTEADCTISGLAAADLQGAVVTATPTNPGRG